MHLVESLPQDDLLLTAQNSKKENKLGFEGFDFAEPILRSVLMEGYTVATPIQAKAIGPVLEGRDVIGCAQTGTGKTAAFALPILHRLITNGHGKGNGRKIRALVLASTRELASQIRDSFYTYGQYTTLRVTAIYGGVSQMPQEKALRNGIDILVATPGRLMDLMQQGFVDLKSVETLVLDEADRMLDMGFLPAIRRIVPHLPKKRQTLLFSATMPEEIIRLASDIITDPVDIKIEPVRKTTDLVDQHVCMVPQKMKTQFLIGLIKEMKPARAIVFSKTKHGADRIAKHLFAANIKADAIHSNKSQNKRQRILEEFKWKNPPILIATDIAARGIDVDGVTHVFNFDMPGDAETYVHRIGRTGRAGASGMAISFCDSEERKLLRGVETLLKRKLPVLQTVEAPRETAEERSSQERGERRSGGRPNSSFRSGSSSQRGGSSRPMGTQEPRQSRSSSPRSVGSTTRSPDRPVAAKVGGPHGSPSKSQRPGKKERAEKRDLEATSIVAGEGSFGDLSGTSERSTAPKKKFNKRS